MWFLLNSLCPQNEMGFVGNNKELQASIYFYIFGKLPQHSTRRGREWSILTEKVILEKSEKLGMPIHVFMSPWYETKITKDNVKEELDKLKAMYENKV